MEVNAVKTVDSAADLSVVKKDATNQATQKVSKVKNETAIPQLKKEKAEQAPVGSEGKDSRELSKKEMEDLKDGLNAVFTAIDSSLHFKVHEETGVVMMQVLSRQDGKLIKEIPSREILDVVARIRDSVGAFLDEKV